MTQGSSDEKNPGVNARRGHSEAFHIEGSVPVCRCRAQDVSDPLPDAPGRKTRLGTGSAGSGFEEGSRV